MSTVLTLESVTIGVKGQEAPLVDRVSFTLERGRTTAIVGESGSGKTLTCKAILGILPRALEIRSGRVLLDRGPKGQADLAHMGVGDLRDIRGDRITMIFQEPMSSLSPVHRIGNQVSEALRIHQGCSWDEARRRTLEKFRSVGFPDPERTWRAYPFELSGGMRQRAMIAMAMLTRPDVLIADEPTTALDVTTQAMVLGLIRELQEEMGMAVAFVTHDLGVVANLADDVVVMRKGRVMEAGEARAVFASPRHPYTRDLMAATPIIPETVPAAPPSKPDAILTLRDITKVYWSRSRAPWLPRRRIDALRGINLNLIRGETLALVGESGSGKSTVARIALAAEAPDGGTAYYDPGDGRKPFSVHAADVKTRRALKREAQMVFQDPYSALSPRMLVRQILTEPYDINDIGSRSERVAWAAQLLQRVGLDPVNMRRYPHAFSGGQRQRIAIARALALEPKLLILDEPTSALDVSVQAQVLELLEDLKARLGLSYLFISHNLAVVAQIADQVAVMRQGLVVEQAPRDALFNDPRHPYTRALIAAVPEADIHRPIDFSQVALGAGEPETWPEPFGYAGDAAPGLIETTAGHFVRMAA